MSNSTPKSAEQLYSLIANEMIKSEAGVEIGKMMTAPGIKYKSKVFAFFYHDLMVFRLGKAFIPEDHGIHQYSYLSPFKNKAPMKNWLEVTFDNYSDQWESLAYMALNKIKNE